MLFKSFGKKLFQTSFHFKFRIKKKSKFDNAKVNKKIRSNITSILNFSIKGILFRTKILNKAKFRDLKILNQPELKVNNSNLDL